MLEDTPPPELPALRRRLEKLRQWDRERRFAELAKALDDSALVQLFIPAADEEGASIFMSERRDVFSRVARLKL